MGRILLITVTVIFLLFLLIMPIAFIMIEAVGSGLQPYAQAIGNQATLHAILLTILVTAVTIVINIIIGLSGAWLISKFSFRGKAFLTTLIELPFSISPVVVGFLFILLFGYNGWFGKLLDNYGIQIAFAVPGIILVTVFVTFPFIIRELIPLMQEQGKDEEETALSLGARGWSIFWHITLPNIKWGLLYGVVLCLARAMGEFGAVSIISGNIQGETDTLTLHIKNLYDGYYYNEAFAVSSLLLIVALATLLIKSFLEWSFKPKTKYKTKTTLKKT
ncbi:MAG: sulfate ABC transporter permease subunit CysW [Alphaproteobacteria bacterium]|nr:sulfate ABC transporter permease subunit CysW [Alphaproteobacteria bacterium]